MSLGVTDTGKIDSHECEMEPVDDSLDEDEIDADTDFECSQCGTKTSPSKGVKSAKRSRRW